MQIEFDMYFRFGFFTIKPWFLEVNQKMNRQENV